THRTEPVGKGRSPVGSESRLPLRSIGSGRESLPGFLAPGWPGQDKLEFKSAHGGSASPSGDRLSIVLTGFFDQRSSIHSASGSISGAPRAEMTTSGGASGAVTSISSSLNSSSGGSGKDEPSSSGGSGKDEPSSSEISGSPGSGFGASAWTS